MTRIIEHFSTDWGAMTATDWFGAVFTVVILVLMACAYYYAFSPDRREKFDMDGKIPMTDDPQRNRKGV